MSIETQGGEKSPELQAAKEYAIKNFRDALVKAQVDAIGIDLGKLREAFRIEEECKRLGVTPDQLDQIREEADELYSAKFWKKAGESGELDPQRCKELENNALARFERLTERKK